MEEPPESLEAKSLQVRWTLAQEEKRQSQASDWRAFGALLLALVAGSTVTFLLWTTMGSVTNGSLALRDAPIDIAHIPMVWRQFKQDVRYAEPPSNDSNAAWSELLPYGQGFVNVDNPRLRSMNPGIPSATNSGKESFGLSVFHQLHCLYIIRSGFYSNLGSELVMRQQGASDHSPQHLQGHAKHCFDYLRQSIMCAGDVSYESAIVTSDGKLVNGVDGWGDWHVCRDWDTIWQYAVQHRGQNFSGIV